MNDIPDVASLPDTIYFSDGTTAPVNIATNVASSVVGSSAQLTFKVTASVTSGWDYLQVSDPGAGFTLYKVVRSDGVVIPVGDQAWTTDRTIAPTGKATADPELHLIDHDSTGSYTLYYRPSTGIPPTIVSMSSVTSSRGTPVSSLDVIFTEPIDLATFDWHDVRLMRNGGANLVTNAVTISLGAGST